MTGEEILSVLRQRFRLLADLPPSTYVVGGAVRDVLVGALPGDLDIAAGDVESLAALLARRSSARPIRLGRKELTSLRLVDGGRIYDLTPLAGESIGTDLQRRDFACNAIAIDCATGLLLDPFGGRKALEERRLTLVRESNLDDDPLRVIKSARMAARYRLSIDESTAAALRRRAPDIMNVAIERVHDELMAILSEPDLARGIEVLRLLNLDQILFGQDLDPAPFKSLAGCAFQTSAALAWIYRETPDQVLHGEARRWRWSLAEERRVFALMRGARSAVRGEEMSILLHDLGLELAPVLAPLLRAAGHRSIVDIVEAVMAARGAEILAIQPMLDGDGIARLTGLSPGPAIGILKRALLEAQLRGEVATRGEAEIFVRSRQS